MNDGVVIGIEAGMALLELAAKVAPSIIAAIQSNGEYTDEQKAELIARVTSIRARVAAYQPVPAPTE